MSRPRQSGGTERRGSAATRSGSELALVTGASRGIGRASALALARSGMSVVACARSLDALERLEAQARAEQLSLRVGVLDLTDPEVGGRAETLLARLSEGRVPTVVVNNAGVGLLGPLELLDLDALRKLFEVNLFGLLRVTQPFLPAMRERGRGRILLMSSVLGRVSLPLHGAYCASKYALEGLGDAMRQELAPFGVEVVLVEPGSVATDFQDRAQAQLEALRRGGSSAYDVALERCEEQRGRSRAGALGPEAVAERVVELARMARPPARALVPARARVPVALAGWLPTRVTDAALARGFGLARARRGPASAPAIREGAALITGAAGGIGRALVAELLELGMQVWASDRDAAGLEQLRAATPASRRGQLLTRVLDVRDAAAITRLAGELEREDLSVVINNAGYAELGPVELVDPDALSRQFAVNLFGPLELTRAVLPRLRARGRARIINLSSVAGRVAFPCMGVYHASKFALEAISDALRVELASFGVDVVAIEPAFIRSKFAATAVASARAQQDRAASTPWAAIYGEIARIIERLERLGGDPRDVAAVVRRAVIAPRPRARYQAPLSAKLAVEVLPRLPTALLDRVWRSTFELDRVVVSQRRSRR
jgi:short-subunit dehydrogenase